MKILPILQTRFALVFKLGVMMLASFALLRAVLFLRTWGLMDTRLSETAYIFGWGLVYDLAFISYFLIPWVILLWILPNRWFTSRTFKILAQVIGFLLVYGLLFGIIAEWFFWSEFSVRFNFISVDYLVYRREVAENILQSYPVFWILPLLFLLTAAIFFRVRPSFLKTMTIRETFSQRALIALALLLIPGSAFLWLNQSQRSLSDNNYVNELASNGPYQLFSAFRNNTLDFQQFYKTGDDQMLSTLLKDQILEPNHQDDHPGLYNIARRIQEKEPPEKLNVILISVESLSARYLSRFGEQKNLTPFMDSWFKEGKLFTNFYATGTRTVRGLEAITLSIPPTPGRSIVKRPDNAHMYSLGKVFKDQGYDIAFLYGGRGYFDNMNAFFSGNGYRVVDQTDMSQQEIHFKNAWGVSDEDLYNRTIYEANQAHASRKHFFFHVMTTSNHQPFTFPGGKIDLFPGEGKGGSGRDGGVKYTDYALSRLMENSKTQPWFDNTLFVVLADHCASSAGKIGLPVEKYHIPLFIYGPKHIEPGEVDTLSSQIDLAPTLLSLLHFSYESFFFGKNILAPEFKERALIANYQKLGILTDKELLILSPGKKINRVDLLSKNPSLKKIKFTYPLVKEMISYYQGADYVLAHRLNRWSENRAAIAENKTPYKEKP